MEPTERKTVFNKPTPDPGLEAVIADCEAELRRIHPSDDAYKATLARYTDLQALRHAHQQPSGLDINTLVLAAANLIGIVVIVGYEQKNLVTTKALGFLKKLI